MQLNKFLWLFLALSVCIVRHAQGFQQENPDYKSLFIQAERLSNLPSPTDKTDEMALSFYKKVISILANAPADRPFLFKTYIAAGTFLQVLDRQKEAINYFEKAFLLKKQLPEIRDSVLFKPLVYCGNGYYRLDQLAAANALYDQAKSIAERYPAVSELERLYNTLGVIAYSTGNYKKSITYYEKAISTLTGHDAYDKTFLVTYKNNLASAYRKLKNYNAALGIYQQLLQYHIETDKLRHNLGAVYLAMGEPEQAIYYLKQVKYEDQKKSNDLAKAYTDLKDYPTAIGHLQRAAFINAHKNSAHQNSDNGITLKLSGDVWVKKNQLRKALDYYQQAISNFLSDFHPASCYDHPQDFRSVYNTSELLEILLEKAKTFRLLYLQQHQLKDLDAALQTYLSFYKLADHVQRFYDTDDARLLISNRKYASQEQAIAICLQLYQLTHQEKYKAFAFFIDEENKANTLSLYLEEAKIKTNSKLPQQLLKAETSLKENIVRLSLQASAEKDSITLGRLKSRINDYSLQLISVQQKINTASGIHQFSSAGKKIEIQTLQQKIPSGSTILSYHISGNDILCFVISKDHFDIFTRKLNAGFYTALQNINSLAQQKAGNNSKQLKRDGRLLYQQLISPAMGHMAATKSLMIIPDGELNDLPFEMLVNDQGENLLRQYTVTYNYSCTILQNSNGNSSGEYEKKLGMAPFVHAAASWQGLPASRKEIETMGGTSFFGSGATKQQFIQLAGDYNLIHLATHAYTNGDHPDQSFIAFYPAIADSAMHYKLYLPEIYNLSLNKTHLVMLSACESGIGEQVKGEGIMSLSRAFSYAGCDHIITSMWKADDASTAYLSEKVHFYLKKGCAIHEALQKAKIDYLDEEQLADTKKLPGYWAHLRLIGNFEQPSVAYTWTWYLLIPIFLFLLIIMNRNRLKRLRPALKKE